MHKYIHRVDTQTCREGTFRGGKRRQRETDVDTHRFFMSLALWEGRREDGRMEGRMKVLINI